jgi:hypothetical protein
MSDRSIYGRHESYYAGGPKITREEFDKHMDNVIKKYRKKKKAKKKVHHIKIEMERTIPKYPTAHIAGATTKSDKIK